MPQPTPYEAAVAAYLTAGGSLNGHADALRETPYRRMILCLADRPAEERAGVLEILRAAVPEGEALHRAILDISNPLGPLPDPDAPGEGPASGPPYRLIQTSDIEPRETEWLWPGRLPLGMLSLFAGDPGLGKSLVTSALIGAVTRGAHLPLAGGPAPGGPCSAVVRNAEDDAARTIVPRLIAAGADRDRVYLLKSVLLEDGREALPSLRADLNAIEDAVASVPDCRLLVIDPVSAYLGGADDHRNAELRGLLSPLTALAERRGLAVVLVTHLTKAGGTNAKHRVIGSIAYVGAAWTGFLFVADRDDPSGRRVLMLANKFNIGPEPPTLAYRVEDRGAGPAVEWEAEPVPITATQALEAEAQHADPAAAAEARECDRWLAESLAAAGGRMLAAEVKQAGRDAGFSADQLERSKRRIGARSAREGFGPGSRCYWEAPGHVAAEPTDPASIAQRWHTSRGSVSCKVCQVCNLWGPVGPAGLAGAARVAGPGGAGRDAAGRPAAAALGSAGLLALPVPR